MMLSWVRIRRDSMMWETKRRIEIVILRNSHRRPVIRRREIYPMQRRISIDQLRVGMYVTGLDKSWFNTPFWRHHMQISNDDQIRALRKAGIRYVEIDTEKGPDLPCPVDAIDPMDIAQRPSGDVTPSSFEEELPYAKQVYAEAKRTIQQAMQDARMGRMVDLTATSNVVNKMVDSLLRNPHALSSLSRLKSFDEYTFFHSVNVAVLGLTMGRSVGMSRDTLFQLGLGMLLHDLGKMLVPIDILNKPARLEPHEFEIIKQHVLRGVELLSQSSGFSEQAVHPALEHHERLDGSGYPFGRKRAQVSRFGLISSVADIYDAMTSDRVYHKGMPAVQALRHLHGLGLERRLELSLVQTLAHSLSIYPVGTCVRLSSGEIGVVSRPNPQQPSQPGLLLVADTTGARYGRPHPLDLAGDRRSIAATLDPSTIGINPNDVIDAAV
ncbi:MAG: hypothetical protein C3F12_02140 [Candidatus Methylomirabilota bacterium]|nr:HD-GYP domain-containing protein [candidate division NC10 bacterium]PWB48580.1 MAG: hypothetical protein C3F12_02140 [candidate division NC10 bacterium]